MKVLLVNGSPHKKGCTYTALSEVGSQLEKQGIETQVFQTGTKSLRGCTGCGSCRKNSLGKCVFDDDIVNEFLAEADGIDGFVFGSPVHYAGVSGTIKSLLDRGFYAGSQKFQYKPGAVLVSARRAGTTAALEQLNKYLQISNMITVSSQYWNMVHGNTPEEVVQDEEGMQIMRTLGKNMAWIMKLVECGKAHGITQPEREPGKRTNFIR